MSFLSDVIAEVRRLTDEPAVNAKVTDSDIINIAGIQYSKIFSDLTRVLKYPPSVVFQITALSSATEQVYVLPPHVEHILCIEQVISTSDPTRCSLFSPHAWQNPSGTGMRVEGNLLIIDKGAVADGTIMRIHYVPSATSKMHSGTAGTVAASSVVLAATPTLGALDTHYQAYAGHILRILSASTNNYVQERQISSYDHTTRIAILRAALSPLPTGTITYEVVPLLHSDIASLVSLAAARRVISGEGNADRLNSLTQSYREDFRDLQMKYVMLDKWLATIGATDTVWNKRYQGNVRY